MPAPLIFMWAAGMVILASTVAYYAVDKKRSGELFRKKIPMLPVGAAGGLLVVVSIAIGLASAN